MHDDDQISVVCLCAAWCGVCRDYRAVIAQVSAGEGAAAAAAYTWVDVEDQAELLGDIDVDNFPTLLIARGGRVVFFGPVTPQPGTLERLVQRAADGSLAPLPAAAEAQGVLQRLRST